VAAAGYGRLCELVPRELWPALRRTELLARLGERAALRPALEESVRRAHASLRTDLVEQLTAMLRVLDAAPAEDGRADRPAKVRAA
jgi:hypothetical protein